MLAQAFNVSYKHFTLWNKVFALLFVVFPCLYCRPTSSSTVCKNKLAYLSQYAAPFLSGRITPSVRCLQH